VYKNRSNLPGKENFKLADLPLSTYGAMNQGFSGTTNSPNLVVFRIFSHESFYACSLIGGFIPAVLFVTFADNSFPKFR